MFVEKSLEMTNEFRDDLLAVLAMIPILIILLYFLG